MEKIIVTSDTVKNGQIEIEDNAGQTTISSEFLAVQQEKIIIRGNPDAGYQLSSLTVNGNAFESGSVYTVTGPAMIKAVFEPVLTPVEVAPKITTTSLKSGMETAAYQELLGASGSTPITWSVVKGRFPDGLTLTASGHIKGTPVIPGTYRFTLRAANSAGSDEKEFTIEIRPLPNGTNYRYKSLNDPVSGITVNGVFSSDAELRIKRNQGLHEEGTCATCDDIRARQKRGELMALYDISLTAGTYQGEVEVSIPLQQAGEEETVYFLHCNHKTEERRMIKVSDGTVTGTFSSLSPFAVAKVSEKKTITGLPKSHTMSVGESVSWTPKPAGGTWSYDKNMLEMSQSGDVYTFTALQTGKTTATYTVDGVTHSVNISMISSSIPKTGDTTNSVIWMLGIVASVLCCLVLVSNRKHENNSRK
ncbi:Ig domain-containing protein [[Clostridium] innocuum]|nr:Ig domain-containing protein [[Clostridium] innocuum]MCR0578140.1 Ig domain-containing protein [[Clostridium] innocuum]